MKKKNSQFSNKTLTLNLTSAKNVFPNCYRHMIREKKFAHLKQIVKKTLELCSGTLCNGAKILVRLIFYFLCPVYIDIFSEIWPMLFKGVLEIPIFIKLLSYQFYYHVVMEVLCTM